MAMTIISNENSFVQFGAPDSFTHCVWGEIRQCLPIFDAGDLAFQFAIQTDSAADAATLCKEAEASSALQVVRNCDDESAFASIPGTFETYKITPTLVGFNWTAGITGFPFDLGDHECFYLRVTVDTSIGIVTACSNCLQSIIDDCFTSVIEYRADENAFGFAYCGADEFFNRVRLPFYLSKPQFPAERNVFRKANGVSKVLSSIIRKTFQGITDYLQETWHQKLMIALNHDVVNIFSKHFTGSVVIDGEYQIGWQEFLDYPVAQATFQIQVTPFNQRNSNCQTCEADAPMTLNDDYITGIIHESDAKTINVALNDFISCCPFTAEITFVNPAYVATSIIDNEGIFSASFLAILPTASNVKIATYKINCPDGSFKEANIYGSFDGSGGFVCCDPYNIQIDYFAYLITWLADCQPENGFNVTFYRVGDPVPIAGSITSPTQLYQYVPDEAKETPGNYYVTIQARCEGADGDIITFNFTTYPATQKPAMASFGELIGDACGTMVLVWITGGTSITAGVTAYLDGALTTVVPGNYITGVDGNTREMYFGFVVGLTGTACF